MLKAVTGFNSVVGSEVNFRDYSEPLNAQRETTSYSSRFVYPIEFDFSPEINNIGIYENQLIKIWRFMARNPYVDFAVDDIVNEMISYKDDQKYPIVLDLNDTDFSKTIRKKIHEEWNYLMKLLKFHKKSYTLLRDWYIDGKQFFYIQQNKKSIVNIIALDPLRTKRIVEENKEDYYYVYQDVNLNCNLYEIPKEQMIELNSGLMDDKHSIWISYLNKSYVPLNQLNNIEDALLIYRIARAPERRVFYIDVGQLPKSKAETYMKEVIRNCRNKMEYDPSTGKMKESVLHMSLLDDIYLPRSSEGRGTEVSLLQGGKEIGSVIPDLEYFQQKLFRALNVPFSRWNEANQVSNVLGRSAEITRDEVKYRKFIVRLRNCYNPLFVEILQRQLALKKIITPQEFRDNYENIMFEWASDSMYSELRDIDVLNERLELVNKLNDYVGVYFSKEYIEKKVLRFTDEEREEMLKQIKAEKESEESDNSEENNDLEEPDDSEEQDNSEENNDSEEQTEEDTDSELLKLKPFEYVNSNVLVEKE